MLSTDDRAMPLHTKIEFSRRAHPDATASVVEPITIGVARTHGLLPFVAPHYRVPTAIQQKVRALVGRATTQARDVFDLATLFSRPNGDAAALGPVHGMLSAAIERAASISYADYVAQVVGYLVPDQAATYSTPDAWAAIQLHVITMLEAAL